MGVRERPHPGCRWWHIIVSHPHLMSSLLSRPITVHHPPASLSECLSVHPPAHSLPPSLPIRQHVCLSLRLIVTLSAYDPVPHCYLFSRQPVSWNAFLYMYLIIYIFSCRLLLPVCIFLLVTHPSLCLCCVSSLKLLIPRSLCHHLRIVIICLLTSSSFVHHPAPDVA